MTWSGRSNLQLAAPCAYCTGAPSDLDEPMHSMPLPWSIERSEYYRSIGCSLVLVAPTGQMINLPARSPEREREATVRDMNRMWQKQRRCFSSAQGNPSSLHLVDSRVVTVLRQPAKGEGESNEREKTGKNKTNMADKKTKTYPSLVRPRW